MSDTETPQSPERPTSATQEHVATPGKDLLQDTSSDPAESSSISDKADPPKPEPSTVSSDGLEKVQLKVKARKRTLAETSSSTPSSSSSSGRSNLFSRRLNTGEKVAAKTTAVKQKPSWMSDETFKQMNNTPPPGAADSSTSAADEEGGPRKLKKPSRRSDRDAMSRRAQMLRDKEEDEQRRLEEEIRMKAQNLDSYVRSHYNERTFIAKKEKRNLSPIIKLRNFNNVIKTILIQSYAQPNDRVLDLGCGKGGDLRKWETARIAQYTGIDISNASIVEAVRRYKHNRSQFEVTFVTGDAFGTPLPAVLSPAQMMHFPVDVVTMQFCLHYAFESEQKARMTIENVARSLKPGGHFIGTIPNSEFIAHKIRRMDPGQRSFGNGIYQVTFLSDPPKSGEFDNPYGNVYNYYLKDAIDNVPEYIIQFEDLRALCDEFGLRLVMKQKFADFFKENIPEWYKRLSPHVLEGIKREDGALGVKGEEAEAAAEFYNAFAFMKAA